jgi:hypothetical protein
MAAIAPTRPNAKGRTGIERPKDAVARSPELVVVSAKARSVAADTRRTRFTILLTVVTVVGTLLLIGAAQAVVASQQVRIDNLQQDLSSSITANQDLQLQRAKIEAPANILGLAQHRLGLVPETATYLPPVNPGPSLLQAKTAESR